MNATEPGRAGHGSRERGAGRARRRKRDARARRGFDGLRGPRPLLSAAEEGQLTPRQHEILEQLEGLTVEDRFADLTMAQLAARTNCSLRTLYGIAPSKDALLLLLVDRRLHRIGRSALGAIEPSMDPLSALRAYLRATTGALGPSTESMARELASVPGGARLIRGHGGYVVAVTQRLLEQALEEGRIQPVDTRALALVLGGLGSYFSRPQVIPRIRVPPKEAADSIMEIILRGLEGEGGGTRGAGDGSPPVPGSSTAHGAAGGP